MGFTCGLYKIKKRNNLSLEQALLIGKYYAFSENEWAIKNYANWKDYARECSYSDAIDTITQEDIDSYKSDYIQREYSKSLTEEVDAWCSDGSVFHDWFMENGKKETDYFVSLDKETIIAALNYCSTQLKSMAFKPVKVMRSFTEDEETEAITSIPCDGVEVEDEDGNIRREYTDDFECSNLFVPVDGYFEEREYNAFTTLLNALINILATTDFENEYVFYEGGW